MRNEPKPLNDLDHRRQARALAALQARETATVSYVKRDGKAGKATGKVAYFNGKPGFDTGSVTIETADRGPRTINLHRIDSIE